MTIPVVTQPIPTEPVTANDLVTNIAFFLQAEMNGAPATGSIVINKMTYYTSPSETQQILAIAAAARQLNLPVTITPNQQLFITGISY